MGGGSEIKKKREAKNLTQEQLAQKFHVDQTTVSKWERDHTYPDFETGKRLSRFLEIPLSGIYENECFRDQTTLPVYRDLLPSHFERNSFHRVSRIEVSNNELFSHASELLSDDNYEIEPDLTQTFFAFLVQNDNMSPYILSNDIAIIKKDDKPRSGEIVLVSVDDAIAEVALIHFHENGVTLSFTNPLIRRVVNKTKSQHKIGEIKILGRVIHIDRDFRRIEV